MSSSLNSIQSEVWVNASLSLMHGPWYVWNDTYYPQFKKKMCKTKTKKIFIPCPLPLLSSCFLFSFRKSQVMAGKEAQRIKKSSSKASHFKYHLINEWWACLGWGGYACSGTYVEVRRQLCGVCSLPPTLHGLELGSLAWWRPLSTNHGAALPSFTVWLTVYLHNGMVAATSISTPTFFSSIPQGPQARPNILSHSHAYSSIIPPPRLLIYSLDHIPPCYTYEMTCAHSFLLSPLLIL